MLCSVALLSGMSTAYDGVNSRVQAYVEECNYPSLTLSTSLQRKKDAYLEEIQSLNEVESCAYRIQIEASCVHNDSTLYSRITSYGGDNFVNYHVDSELENEPWFAIAISDRFASRANIQLGDQLKVSYSWFSLTFTVNRILSSCEGYSEKQNDILPGGSGDFGYLYIEENILKRIGLGNYFNQIIIDAKSNNHLDQLKEKVRTASSLSIDSLSSIEESPVYNNISYNIAPLKSASIYFPIIFYFLAAIVAILFIYLMAKSYQNEMGILLCLGYQKIELGFMFAFIGFLSAIISCLFGLTGGYFIGVMGYRAYASHFGLSESWISFSALGTSLSVVCCFAIMILAAIFSSFLLLHKLTPIEAVNGTVENSNFAVKNKKLPLNLKLTLNRTLRNLKNNLFSIFTFSLSFALIYASFSFAYARRVVVSDLFETRMDFTALVFFQTKQENQVDASFKDDTNILEYEIIDWAEVDAKANGTSSTGVFVGLDHNQTMLKILDSNRNEIENPYEGAILDSHVVESLSLAVGDSFQIGDNSFQLENVTRQDSFRLNYLPKSVFETTISSYSLCALVQCDNFSKLKEVSSSYKNCVSVISMDKMRSSLNSSISKTDTAVEVIVIMSILLSVAITTNLKEEELYKERHNIALQRSMGYSLPRVSLSLLIPDLVKVLLSFPIGYGFGVIISIYILGKMDAAVFSFPFVNAGILFFGAAGILLVLQLISHFFIHLHLSQMNLAIETKGRE